MCFYNKLNETLAKNVTKANNKRGIYYSIAVKDVHLISKALLYVYNLKFKNGLRLETGK